LPLVRAVTEPTWSLAVDPTRLLAAETAPVMPVVPEPQVTAPAFATEPFFQGLLLTT